MQLLGRLEREWYHALLQQHSLPSFNRLWGLAQYLRDRRLGRKLPDTALFGLVTESLIYCVGRFDERHPPKKGPQRRSIQDRFTSYFARKLKWAMNDMRRAGKKKRVRDAGRYRGPRADRYEHAVQPKCRTNLFKLLQRAMRHLDAGEIDLLTRRFWAASSWTQIAAECGFTSRFQAQRRFKEVEAKLRAFVCDELRDTVVHAEDDFGVVELAA